MASFNSRSTHNKPVVVLALPASARTAAVGERLEAHGWQVLRAATNVDARRLACRQELDAVVLPVDAPDESGWITCAKLRCGRPHLRVLLVGERTPAALRFARFVGAAALIPADGNPARLAEAVARSAGTVAV